MSDLSYAVLIDAGFAKYALKAKRFDPAIDEKDVSALIAKIGALPVVAGMRLHRVYWYDAKPLVGKVSRPDGKETDFSASEMARISNAQHAAIARLPYVAMRFGELSYRGWRLKDHIVRSAKETREFSPDDLVPNVQQKGVDMRIGLDIAALALKRQAHTVVLVSGDSDLAPAMKFARREGMQVVLMRLGKNVKDLMHEHADIVIEQRLQDLP